VIGVVTLTSLAVLSFLLNLVVKAQKTSVTTGVEELLHAVGEVVSWSQGKGDVRVTGEIWQAVADADFILQKGDAVRVISINGLKLTVAPADQK
jgi:membrane-bound serine protease (ClpP class)